MVFRSYARFLRVVRQFLPLAIAYARDRRRWVLVGGSRRVDADTQRRRAERLLDSMLTLGPTFIKLGQLLSTRPDVLPPAYIEEFTRLQDDVPPADWPEAKAILEADLGPIEEVFTEFDTAPISGASLGQVYAAEIDGEPVAVKVRRPGVEELVAADLRVIKWLLPILLYFVDDTRSFSLETMAEEFERTITEEMDYEREARMCAAIGANFADDPGVAIPDVYDDYSTDRVLVMEYVDGTKVTDLDDLDARGIDRTDLAERLERTYFQMIVDDGVYQADPHPGNLAVQDDGTLVFYDFGMSGQVDSRVRDQIVEFYVAVAEQDIDGILDALIQMGTLSPEADRQIMADVLELAIADARGEEIDQYRVQEIVQRIEDTIYEFPFRLPPNLALVLRVATVVEGVCVTLDPGFDFIAVATEYLADEGHLQRGVERAARDAGRDLRAAGEALVSVPPKLDRTLDRIDRDALTLTATIDDENGHIERLGARITLGMVAAAGVLSTAILQAFGTQITTLFAALGTLVVGIALYRSFRKQRGIRAKPQFTRQNLGAGDGIGGDRTHDGTRADDEPIAGDTNGDESFRGS
ncbi:ABC1 kinase family protein [Halococcoides cellulosivorans]|uniref:ABC1 atypical kinase-like domain-containing protein n=1 Tax=Halococcoides cellulosivorans TaxID=1679096 RepID=A0A2R4X225_9EURY|nr:AarF/ABC1/UbiB kinase family protein [Halococcoides cellulosivorans]AWB27838.1 hypothetical protein HARCEL1_09000 [Halococcoides cellulosivorans]